MAPGRRLSAGEPVGPERQALWGAGCAPGPAPPSGFCGGRKARRARPPSPPVRLCPRWLRWWAPPASRRHPLRAALGLEPGRLTGQRVYRNFFTCWRAEGRGCGEDQSHLSHEGTLGRWDLFQGVLDLFLKIKRMYSRLRFFLSFIFWSCLSSQDPEFN